MSSLILTISLGDFKGKMTKLVRIMTIYLPFLLSFNRAKTSLHVSRSPVTEFSEAAEYREYPASTIGAGLALALSFKEFFSLK